MKRKFRESRVHDLTRAIVLVRFFETEERALPATMDELKRDVSW